MKKLTPEQVRGTKFEIWFEQLLKDNRRLLKGNKHYWSVRRNVNYHRSRYRFRQVDVEYKTHLEDGSLHLKSLVICELKYSSSGKVRLELRRIKEKSGQVIETIDNIINELEERRKFVKARKAILITNRGFTDETYREAEQYSGIELYDSAKLEELDRKRRGFLDRFFPKGTVEEQIKDINLREYNLKVVKEDVGLF